MARARSCAWFWHMIKYAQDLGIATSCAWHRIEHAQDMAPYILCGTHRIALAQDVAPLHPVPHQSGSVLYKYLNFVTFIHSKVDLAWSLRQRLSDLKVLFDAAGSSPSQQVVKSVGFNS